MSLPDRYLDVASAWWIGNPLDLRPIPAWKGTLTIADDDQVVLTSALSGRRVASLLPVTVPAPRTWTVQIPGAHQGEVDILRDIAGRYGPWTLVPPHAQTSNLLTPARTAFLGHPTMGSHRLDGGGRALRALALPEDQTPIVIGSVPVQPRDAAAGWPGAPITAAARLGRTSPGLVRAQLQWLDAADASLGTVTGTEVSGADVLRTSVISVPVDDIPALAVRAQLEVVAAPPWASGVTGLVMVAEPQVSWTDWLPAWTPGEGVREVVVHDLSRDVVAADRWQWGRRRSTWSFSVSEVGDA